jgi:hypothetical protein
MIIAWMALDLGSEVIVESNVGVMTRPEFVFAVAAGIVSELLLPIPDASYAWTR